jgi:hypothetical protein
MTIDIELVPGFKKHPRRAYIYVQGPDVSSFRSFFEKMKLLPGVLRPTSGGMMNDEIQLIVPSIGSYFAVSLVGDKGGWNNMIEAYCQSVGVKFAHIDGSNLVVSDGRQVPLSLCTLQSSHGLHEASKKNE